MWHVLSSTTASRCWRSWTVFVAASSTSSPPVNGAPSGYLKQLRALLGDRAIVLMGEKSLGVSGPIEANTTVCMPWQPGLGRAIARARPDVIVGDGFLKWTYAALLQRMLRGTPLVVCYERWAHVERNAQWYRKAYRKFALGFTDAISCNGRLSLEYTVSLGFPRERITTGHMAADLESMERGAGSEETKAESRKLKAEILGLHQEWTPGDDGQSPIPRSPTHGNIEAQSSAPPSPVVSSSVVPGSPVVSSSSGRPSEGLVFLYVGRLIKIKGVAELLRGWEIFEKAESRKQKAEIGSSRAESGKQKAESSSNSETLKAETLKANLGISKAESGKQKAEIGASVRQCAGESVGGGQGAVGSGQGRGGSKAASAKRQAQSQFW